MFEIESNIPLPVLARNNKGESKYPLSKLDVGQSFFLPDRDTGFAHTFISYWCKRNPDKKFTTRTVDGGVRIWRTQ